MKPANLQDVSEGEPIVTNHAVHVVREFPSHKAGSVADAAAYATAHFQSLAVEALRQASRARGLALAPVEMRVSFNAARAAWQAHWSAVIAAR